MANPNLVRKAVDPTSSTSSGEMTSLSQILPPGTVLDTAATAAPSGWLFCYGQAISRTTYAALFAAIGTTYGIGDGSTTFNLPDTRGRTRASKDDMGGSAANRLTVGGSGVGGTTLGATGGAETHTLTTAQIPSHLHSVTDPNHSHNVLPTLAGASPTSGNYLQGALTYAGYGSANTAGAATGISIQNTGGGGVHQNTQPTIIFNTIIKY